MNKEKLQKNIEDSKTAYDKVSLSAEEKNTLRASLFEKIDSENSKTAKALPSPFFNFTFYVKATSLSFAAFVIFMSPIIAAAEKSLPGEFLYEIKTNVNEEVAEVFVPKEEKESYKKSLMTKRAFEVKKLSEKGELNDIQIKDVERAIKKSVSKVVASEASEDKSEEDIIKDHKDAIAIIEFSQNIIESKKIAGTSSTLEELKTLAQASLMTHVESISENEEELEESVENLIEDAKEIIKNVPEEEKEDWKEESEEVEDIEAEENSDENNDGVVSVKINTTTTATTSSTSILVNTTDKATTSSSILINKDRLGRILDLYEDISEQKVESDIEKLSNEFLK